MYSKTNGKPQWASLSFALLKKYIRPYKCTLNENGILELYNGKGGKYWDSGKNTNQGNPPFTLRMQDNGRIVIFDADGNAGWSQKTHPLVLMINV